MINQGLKNPAAGYPAMQTLPLQRQQTVVVMETHGESVSLIARAQTLFNRMVGIPQPLPDCFSEQTFWETSSQLLQVPSAWRRDPQLRKTLQIH